MAGAPRKPIKLMKLQGTLRKDQLKRNPPEAKGELECPSWLTDEGKKEWNRVTVELTKIGIIGTIDTSMLSIYCDMFGAYIEARDSGNPKGVNFIGQLRYMAGCFGLYPTSREKLSTKKPEESGNPFKKVGYK